MRSLGARAAIVWELPLGILSFVFFKITKFCFGRLIRLNDLLFKRQAFRWRVTSAQQVRSRLVMTAFMTSAPRWNTQAIIATAGPFEVKATIRLHAAAAHRSARSWTAVAHGFPMYRIGASIDSLRAPTDEAWQTLHVAPGRYRVVLRYYQWSEQVELPSLEVDGVEVVPAQPLAADINDFYNDLARQRTSLFYLCLHYYTGPLLRYQRWFPRTFVAREYLPAGNPETEFYYGSLRTGEALAIELHPQLLQTYDVYFNSYNLASFPVQWYRIQDHQHTTAASPGETTYLIRVHQKALSDLPFDHDWVRLRILPRGQGVDREAAPEHGAPVRQVEP